MIECSTTELDTLSRRAARGAGYAWGLAEEAGKATRWLAVRRLPSVGLMARHLLRSDSVAYDEMVPAIHGRRWSARSGNLCPVITGAALSDCARDIASGVRVTLTAVAFPLLLSPFISRAAILTNHSFEIRWPGISIRCFPNEACLDFAEQSALEAESATEVTVGPIEGDFDGQPIQQRAGSVRVALDDWNILKLLAGRTFVPATEESRMLGAGAGLRDND